MISQEDPEGDGELIIYVFNNIGYDEIKIEVRLISSLCWDATNSDYDLHNITTQYPGSYRTTSDYSDRFPWGLCSSQQMENMFGLGNYRVTGYKKINGEFESTDYFDIDYRTSDIPENNNNIDLKFIIMPIWEYFITVICLPLFLQ